MNRRTGLVLKFGFGAAVLCILLAASSAIVFAHNGDDHAQVQVQLRHTPHGSAHLVWEPMTKTLTVNVMVIGLQANTRHPDHIHTGSCAATDGIIFPLNDVIADAGGVGTSNTVVQNVMGGIPATGWSLNIHSGPTLGTAAQALPISCGDIINAHPSTNEVQRVMVNMDGTVNASQEAFGSATLTLNHGTLTVMITLFGLLPGSSHAAHIHAGQCERQIPGNVVHPLSTLTADGNGVARATTVIPNVAEIPEDAWYINVHFSTDLSNQNGFDPIACGNVED